MAIKTHLRNTEDIFSDIMPRQVKNKTHTCEE